LIPKPPIFTTTRAHLPGRGRLTYSGRSRLCSPDPPWANRQSMPPNVSASAPFLHAVQVCPTLP